MSSLKQSGFRRGDGRVVMESETANRTANVDMSVGLE